MSSSTFKPVIDLDTKTYDEIERTIRSLRFVDAKVLIWLGVECGWTPHAAKSIHMVASGGGVSVEIPPDTSLNANVFRSKVRTILRHRSVGTPPLLTVLTRVEEAVRLDASRRTMLRKLIEEAPPVEKVPAVVPSQAPQSEPSQPEVTHRKRRIIRQEPWAAHGSALPSGATATYPSKAVDEREWSDGTLDYACTHPDCEYVSDSPRSVAAHYTSHTRGQGRQPQAVPDGVDEEHTVSPRKATRIRNLRRELDGALNAAFANNIDWAETDQASWLATWIINHRVEAVRGSDTEGEATVGEGLDTDQILDRIAALVDRGRSSVLREQIASLSQQLDEAEIREREAQSARQEAQAAADKANNNLKALRDLITETTEDK